MSITLSVAKRDKTTNAEALRETGLLPGVVYGPKQDTIDLSIDQKEFTKVFESAGESTIIELTGLSEPIEVLVHDLSFDPVKGGYIHVDFYAIERGKEMTTDVPLEFIGEAPVTKSGATVNKILHEVEVTCRPSDLPSHIDVDISGLADEESHITIADIKVPAGVTITNQAEDIVANVSAAREEEPEEVTESVDMSAIAVEEKGKKETEEEE